MTPHRSRSSKRASEFGHRPQTPTQGAPATGKRRPAGPTPEDTARAAVAHETTASPTGDRVKLTLTVSLSRAQAERLTARAIREGKNLHALVAEILEATPTDA